MFFILCSHAAQTAKVWENKIKKAFGNFENELMIITLDDESLAYWKQMVV